MADSITYFGTIPVYGLSLQALDFVGDAFDAMIYLEQIENAPPADPARMPDDPQAVTEAAIAAEVCWRVK
jgi:hypothetical protein